MRIAINTRLLVPGKMDGIGWFTYETTRRMVQAHPEHQFFLLFDRQPNPRFQFGDNATPVVLPPPARHPILWWLFFEVSVSMFLRSRHINLFLSPDGFLPLHTKTRTLAVIHDINFEHASDNLRRSHQRFMTHFFPKYAHQATRIATVSDYSRKDIALQYGIDTKNIDVVYDGANNVYRPHTEREMQSVRERFTGGKPFIIFVSTILKRKNLQHLLTAFDQLKSMQPDDLQLIVVGNRAWWGNEIAQAYNNMVHKGDVLMLGHLEPTDLAALVSASVCLVYPSYFEGFGIPILEAMYAETAVVCSRTTSMPEVGGDAVLYIDPDDTEGIAQAISKLRDPMVRNELIEKGREQRKLFSWDRTADLLWESMMKATV